MVPRLTTALTGPLRDLEKQLLDNEARIEQWLRAWWQTYSPPFYASVDLRNAGFKLAPVDTNLFPGGFNNLSPAVAPLCIQAMMAIFDKVCPDARNLLLIPENHTRNGYYLLNVAHLVTLLRHAGLNVRIGSLLATTASEVSLPDGRSLLLEPLKRLGTGGERLGLEGFDPCAILLNNDLSAGVPPILENITQQYLIPPLAAGWHLRRKSRHFAAYHDVAQRFAHMLSIDPWLIDPDFELCGEINFQERTGEECLAFRAEILLDRIRAKYREYGIKTPPFVIVKADAGTYGMGIMTVRDPSEIKALNRRQRNKLAVVKEGLAVQEVMIQEGVPTIETVDAGTAEPVVYMVDRYVVGGFYRINTERGIDENLNAPGMRFSPLAFETGCSLPDGAQDLECASNRFYAYGVVARLALATVPLELAQTRGNA